LLKDGRKPEFIKKISDQEGSIGGSISFRVEFEGKPVPVAKWFKNGIEIVQGQKYAILSEEFSSILTLKNLSNNDNNQIITCQIQNPLGKEVSEAFIKIIAVPKAEKEPGDQSVSLGETLKIKIPVVGKGPFTLKLNRDDDEPLDETKYTLTEAEGVVTLTIPSKNSEFIPNLLLI
jgi:hypothetical protein